jgi:hypothetical protein
MTEANVNPVTESMGGRMIESTDADGQRVVILDGRLSVYGSPSMIRTDGTIAIGADVPPEVRIVTERLR